MTTTNRLLGLLATLMISAPALAQTPAGTVTTQPPVQRWSVEADVGLAHRGEYDGLSFAVRGGWSAGRHLVIGAGVETSRLDSSGSMIIFNQAFQSTLFAAFARGQWPIDRFTPYAELGLGYVAVHRVTGQQTQCAPLSGAGGSVALGGEWSFNPSLAVGLRAAVRNPGWGAACPVEQPGGISGAAAAVSSGAAPGDWTWMRSVALTLAYRW